MTFYQRLCGMNYPTVLVLLWSAGAFAMLSGAFLALRGLTWIGMAMAVAGILLIALPFVLNPWSTP